MKIEARTNIALLILFAKFPPSMFTFAFSKKAVALPLRTPEKYVPTNRCILARSKASADESSAEQLITIPKSNDKNPWASNALLFSSFTDGIVSNSAARSFLLCSLLCVLLREQIEATEEMLKSSAEFSPCCGPNVDALNGLECVDELYQRGQRYLSQVIASTDKESTEFDAWAENALGYLLSEQQSKHQSSLDVRILYIPTAMYALNPKSSNTPGKQRQRARADGKKRRTHVLQLVDELLSSHVADGCQLNLLGVTLDLADGSLKQPVGSDDASLFPKDDISAISSWQAHLIYVEGGNTFWLQHCIEEGGYADVLKKACTGKSGAMYCGKSAGAIVAGDCITTATWKGWDDPSVVPGRETYDKWENCKGLGLVGEFSFFPHMSGDWDKLVEENMKSSDYGSSVCCLWEEDTCCVIGDEKKAFILSGSAVDNVDNFSHH